MNFQAASLFFELLNSPSPSTGLETWTRLPSGPVGCGMPRNLSTPNALTWSW